MEVKKNMEKKNGMKEDIGIPIFFFSFLPEVNLSFQRSQWNYIDKGTKHWQDSSPLEI